jgi:glycosyltransferase involved in cell wall biosynthesis
MAERDSVCVIVPTYNNASVILPVLEQTLKYCKDLIVVNDGSTDNTAGILNKLIPKIQVLSYEKNKGKGYALAQAFSFARHKGYRYAITLDSDGQHFPDDIPSFLQAIDENPGAVIVKRCDISGEIEIRDAVLPDKACALWDCKKADSPPKTTACNFSILIKITGRFRSLCNY